MSDQTPLRPVRQPWEKPTFRNLGNVGQVLQFPGEGKLSQVADDMGDAPRKPKGTEPM
jgi:hypothetical protein